MCKLIKNNGFGPASNNSEGVLSDNGWYDTNQWNLDLIFNTRMKQYECLTNDSSMASAIFVPFYAGFDAQKYLYGGYNSSVRDAASLDLQDWLQKLDEWKRMNGKDHFLVGGRTTWNFRRPIQDEQISGNSFLNLPVARNMTMLLIESNPQDTNDFAIPYPTYFHPSKDSDVFAWQNKVMKWDRKWLFSFVGESRDYHDSIRSRIIDQCRNSSVGKYFRCGNQEIYCHSPSFLMNRFGRSVFCLQPRGDTPTRRSTFDSILAGCIPVFFHPDSFYTQYTWHVPKNHKEYSVFISEEDIRKNVSIEKRLGEIDPAKIMMMRREVINLIPKMIYAESKLDTLKDAFDTSVETIINKVNQLRRT
ncbi:xyloglucan galactosyltransferase KATAMARI1 homolog [Rutidosis leptorrhynchoides]|uniref:xyloglucan galactosyltransferase KATAMARI1 homolog n=1 Tax=Rutidosis leptorrhynchoides TaxID=125765 RepID=UPI003A99C09F